MRIPTEGTPAETPLDPVSCRAVLIGASEYSGGLGDRPSIAENLNALRAALTDPAILGLADEHCVVVGQTELAGRDRGAAALDAIRLSSDAAPDVLLVYYAGHGVIDPLDDDQLLLAMPDSILGRAYSFLSYDDVRSEMRLKAGVRVVILDCCYSGRAVTGDRLGGPDADRFAATARAPGVCVITATSRTEEALAPADERYTAFTGEIIKALRHGDPSGGPWWNAQRLFSRIRTALGERGMPPPEISDWNFGSSAILARNVAHRPAREVAPALKALFQAQLRAADIYLYHLVGARPAMIDVYVRQDLRGAPTGPSGTADSTGGTASTSALASGLPRQLHEVLGENRHFTVIGGPGLGKSTQTVRLAAELARHWLKNDDEDAAAPRLIPLRTIASVLATERGSFDQAVVRAARVALGTAADSQLPDNLLDLAPDGAEWLILVDGIDEIADARLREHLLWVLGGRAKETDSRYRFLVATRPLLPGRLEVLGPRVGRYLLQPFDLPRLTEFANRWFEGTEESAVDFLAQVRKARLSELTKIPLLATIAAITYESHPEVPLPSNLYGLYEQYLSYLVAERAEEAHQQWRKLRERLAAFTSDQAMAAKSLFQQRMDLTHHLGERAVAGRKDLMAEALSWVSKNCGTKIPASSREWRDLVAAALNSTGLFTYDGGQLAFIHASFGEHLAAAAAARELPERFFARGPWLELLAQAAEPDGDQSRAVLLHHALRSVEANSARLLDYLLASPEESYQLLAGRLISESVPATSRHLQLFMQRLEAHRFESSHTHILDWFSVASRMPGSEFRAHLEALATNEIGLTPDGVRVAACVALRESAPALAAATLRELLHAGSITTRQTAASAMIGLGPDYLAEVIAFLLTDGDTYSWLTAIEVLKSLDDSEQTEATAVMRGLLRAPRRGVRLAAAKVLLNSRRATCPQIIRGLAGEDSHDDWSAVTAAFLSLPSDGRQRAAEALRPLLNSPRSSARRHAAVALARLEPAFVHESLSALLSDSDPGVRQGARDVLCDSSPGFLINGLITLLRHPRTGSRQAQAIAELGHHCMTQVEMIFETAVVPWEPERRLGLALDLARLDKRCAAWPMAVLRTLASDPDPDLRSVAISCPLASGPDQSAEALDNLDRNAAELGSAGLREVANSLLRLRLDVVADHLCRLRTLMDLDDFGHLCHRLRVHDQARVAQVAARLVPRTRHDRTAAEVLAELDPGEDLRPLRDAYPDDDIENVVMGGILEELAAFGPDDTDLAAEVIRHALIGQDAALQRNITSRLAGMSRHHASAVALATARPREQAIPFLLG